MQVWSEIEQGYVDASTADNNINTTDNQYFDLVLNKFLGCFDKMDNTGKVVLCCVSKCRHIITHELDNFEDNDTLMVFDTGATAHMRKHKQSFEPGTYCRCYNTFASMGDDKEVPIIGYSVSFIKVNGKVVCQVMSLHVPNLDTNLFSSTRHR